eukprot:tig00020902_g15043.t1
MSVIEERRNQLLAGTARPPLQRRTLEDVLLSKQHDHDAPLGKQIAIFGEQRTIEDMSKEKEKEDAEKAKEAMSAGKSHRGVHPDTGSSHKSHVWSISASPDGSMLCTAGWDKRVFLWDTNPPSDSPRHSLKGHEANVRACAFSADGRSVATGGGDCSLRVWSTATGELEFEAKDAHKDVIWALAWRGSDTVCTASEDRTLALWTKELGKMSFMRSHPLKGHKDWVRACAFSADGRLLASAGDDELVIVWDCASARPVVDKTVKVWDASTLKLLARLELHKDVVWGVQFSPDAQQLASASEDRTVILWSTKTWEKQATLQGHLDWCRNVAYSSDGTTICSGSDDETLKLWDHQSQSEVATLQGHEGALRAAAFQPGTPPTYLVSASTDKTLRVWNIKSGRSVATLRGHRKAVNAVDLSPDGRWIASGSADNDVKLWNAESYELVETLRGHARDVRQVRFAGQRLLVTVSDDRTVKVPKSN